MVYPSKESLVLLLDPAAAAAATNVLEALRGRECDKDVELPVEGNVRAVVGEGRLGTADGAKYWRRW